MSRLFVIPGHGAGDPGAGGSVDGVRYDEAERVRALASLMQSMAPNDVELADFSRDYYKDGGVSTLAPGTVAIELHMDSGPSSARGGHVIIKQGMAADAYDQALAANISAIFPGRSNTIVGRSDLANINRAAKRGVNYRLLEVCFISNPDDLRKFNTQADEVSRAILSAFGISAGGGQQSAPPEPVRDRSVQVWSAWLGNPNQQWWVRTVGDGEIALRSVACDEWLSDPNSATYSSAAQTWGGANGNRDPREPQILAIEPADDLGGWYVHPRTAPGLSLEGGVDNGDPVEWRQHTGEACQVWHFVKIGTKYLVVNGGTLKALDIPNGGWKQVG